MFVYKVPKWGINATGTKEHLPNQSWCEVCGGVLQYLTECCEAHQILRKYGCDMDKHPSIAWSAQLHTLC